MQMISARIAPSSLQKNSAGPIRLVMTCRAIDQWPCGGNDIAAPQCYPTALISDLSSQGRWKAKLAEPIKQGAGHKTPAAHFNWKVKHINSGRLTSGSRPGQAVPSPFCQRSKNEGKLRPKFTKCEKINIFEHATDFRPPVAMAKPKWRQILLSLTLFSNVTSKERKPMSCACSVFIPVKRMGVCNFSPMG